MIPWVCTPLRKNIFLGPADPKWSVALDSLHNVMIEEIVGWVMAV